MKRWFVFILVSWFAVPSMAQGELNQVDDQGRKQGEWIKKYSNGEVRYTGQFLNDIPVDTFTYFYPGGELLAKTVHRSGGVSYTQMFHRNGNNRAKGKYVKEERDSVWTFYQEDGTLISRETYVLGAQDGFSYAYFKDGSVAEKVEYKNGLKHGKWVVFYEEGSKQMTGHHVEDKWDGEFNYYFPDGRIQFRGKYKEGLKVGIWYEYNTQGDLIAEEQYQNGLLKVRQEKE